MGKYAPRSELQKGGCAGWWRRAVIGLGLILGPIPKEVWTGKYARLATRIRSLMGKAAHLSRVKECVMPLLVPGRELRTWQERNSMKFKSTCEDWRAIVFHNKIHP